MKEYPSIPVSEIHRAGGLGAWLSREARKLSRPMPGMSGSVSTQPDPSHARNLGVRVSEHDEQKALIAWCKAHEYKYPDLAHLYAVPNGGYRHKATAEKMKAEGQKPGMPDLCLPIPRGKNSGLYVELKAAGGTISEHQHKTMLALSKAGHVCVVCWGWEQAWEAIEVYLCS